MYFSGWRTHFLPHEDVMDHGAPAEYNAEADEDGRDNRRRRVELDERVQDHACGSQCELVRKRRGAPSFPEFSADAKRGTAGGQFADNSRTIRLGWKEQLVLTS